MITLDAAAPASREIFIRAPEQDCGCTWCGDPTRTLEPTGKVGWSTPSDTSAYPVVRFTLVSHAPPSLDDTLEPPSPVDVALTPTTPSSDLVIRATHRCPASDVFDVSGKLCDGIGGDQVSSPSRSRGSRRRRRGAGSTLARETLPGGWQPAVRAGEVRPTGIDYYFARARSCSWFLQEFWLPSRQPFSNSASPFAMSTGTAWPSQ